jgi:hypothetical protein
MFCFILCLFLPMLLMAFVFATFSGYYYVIILSALVPPTDPGQAVAALAA